jgi:L-threonylcarbamoyladenylate synthase
VGGVEQAVKAIQGGQPVILPTDTVYGLCTSPYRPEPVARVYRLKNRPETTPSALLVASVEMLFECMPELLGRYGLIASAVVPGP